MIHNVAELLCGPFVDVMAYGTAAYVLAKGIIGTLRDVVDFLILLLS